MATHKLLPACAKNAYSTDEAHMPEAFLKPEWDDVGIKGWPRKMGPSCAAVVERIFDRAKAKEQAYSPAPSVLNLSKRYGDDRLEAACAHALPELTSPRCRHLKTILGSNLDAASPLAPTQQEHAQAPRGHVRGADYYRDR